MTKFKDKMNSYKKHPGSFLLLLLVVAAAIITVFSHWNIIRITYPCFRQ